MRKTDMDFVRGALSGIGEGAVAIAVGGFIDGAFSDPFKDPEGTLISSGLKLIGHLGANGAALVALNRAGLLSVRSPTGLLLFTYIYVGVQRKLCRRIQIFASALDRAIAGVVGTPVPPAPTQTA